jgi:hypothetical protein
MSLAVKCISFIYALYLFSVLNEYRFMFSVVNLVILCTFHSIYVNSEVLVDLKNIESPGLSKGNVYVSF